MTSLRYAVPVIKAVRRSVGVDLPLVFDTRSSKYNSIATHRDRFLEICKENDLSVLDVRHVGYVKFVLCVECISPFEFDRRISFQHGYDYVSLARGVDGRTKYVYTDEQHLDASRRIGVDGVVSPVPPTLWDHEATSLYVSSRGLEMGDPVTLFYPESGHASTFRSVYDATRSSGHRTYVKQRRKNQPIPRDVEERHYDDVWYPSESIFLPLASTACIGFGTSAYTDLIHVRDFHDICAPSYSMSYVKPTWSSSYRQWTLDAVPDLIDLICKGGLRRPIVTSIDDESIDDFVREIWHATGVTRPSS